ncbi:unnamed protein product [Protopolystoma xenopodis]|uniref:Uncharacterized protein n=1 Tax=Protopolystoma xenopodis TaxID=117903 RepID=A0A448XKB4_9PLAT|nr:unnamed protein product [Protopolystoma xenopodis]
MMPLTGDANRTFGNIPSQWSDAGYHEYDGRRRMTKYVQQGLFNVPNKVRKQGRQYDGFDYGHLITLQLPSVMKRQALQILANQLRSDITRLQLDFISDCGWICNVVTDLRNRASDHEYYKIPNLVNPHSTGHSATKM